MKEDLLGTTACRDDGARLDIAATGFWGCGSQRAFFDVRVFNPCAQSFRSLTLQLACFRNEQEKTQKYQQPVYEVEHGPFTPLAFKMAGGMGKAATFFVKRLASEIAREVPRNIQQGAPHTDQLRSSLLGYFRPMWVTRAAFTGNE